MGKYIVEFGQEPVELLGRWWIEVQKPAANGNGHTKHETRIPAKPGDPYFNNKAPYSDQDHETLVRMILIEKKHWGDAAKELGRRRSALHQRMAILFRDGLVEPILAKYGTSLAALGLNNKGEKE